MSARDSEWSKQIDAGLRKFSQTHSMPGLLTQAHRQALIEQFVESIHRVEFVRELGNRPIAAGRLDPGSGIYDPIRAAALLRSNGALDEAFWQAFLSVHFGKNRKAGWKLAANVYGALGQGPRWDWARTSANPKSFRSWLKANNAALRQSGAFGNHRKYVSLDASSSAGTGAAVETYIDWIQTYGSHANLIMSAQQSVGHDPKAVFGHLYRSMDAVASFARTGKFDYLTMIGKLKLAPIEPGSAYLVGATGPLAGARLLFGSGFNRKQFDQMLIQLGAELQVGMQEVEDAICNWQKSPGKFRPFRG